MSELHGVYSRGREIIRFCFYLFLLLWLFYLLIVDMVLAIVFVWQVATKYPGNALPHRPTLLQYIVSSKVFEQ